MRLFRAALIGSLALAAVVPAVAMAHPLGNFTVNQYTRLDLGNAVSVRYVLDMAEIPTFQRRQIVDANGDGRISPAEAASESKRLVAIVAAHSAHGRRASRAAHDLGAAHQVPARAGRPLDDAARCAFPRRGPEARRLAPHLRALQQLRDRPRGLARAARREGRRRRRALDRCIRPRPHARPHALSDRSAALAAGRAFRDDRGGARIGRSLRAGHSGQRRIRARRGLRLGQERRRLRLADRERRLAERLGRGPRAQPGARVRHGPCPHARPRQDDGGRLSRRHARAGATRADPGRHRHGHAHGRGVRAGHRHALALAVHRPRATLSVAQSGLGRDGRGHRRLRDPRPSAPVAARRAPACGRHP